VGVQKMLRAVFCFVIFSLYTVSYTRNERNGLAWFKTGIWELKGMRRGFEKGRCPLCREEEYAIHILKMFGNEEVEGEMFV
jgi:hypothetical protein